MMNWISLSRNIKVFVIECKIINKYSPLKDTDLENAPNIYK